MFDIRRTSREAYDHARRSLYSSEQCDNANGCSHMDDLTLDNSCDAQSTSTVFVCRCQVGVTFVLTGVSHVCHFCTHRCQICVSFLYSHVSDMSFLYSQVSDMSLLYSQVSDMSLLYSRVSDMCHFCCTHGCQICHFHIYGCHLYLNVMYMLCLYSHVSDVLLSYSCVTYMVFSYSHVSGTCHFQTHTKMCVIRVIHLHVSDTSHFLLMC